MGGYGRAVQRTLCPLTISLKARNQRTLEGAGEVVLELKPSALCTLAKCSTADLSPIQCRKILLRVWVLK